MFYYTQQQIKLFSGEHFLSQQQVDFETEKCLQDAHRDV